MKPFTHFHTEILMFCKFQEAAVNPLLLVWNLQDVVVKPFAHFYIEISMVLEASGGCCESIINVLESPEGCCEDICTFFERNINGF